MKKSLLFLGIFILVDITITSVDYGLLDYTLLNKVYRQNGGSLKN